MILVKPSHEILTVIDGDSIIERIEQAGRICYRSKDKITPGSAKKFVERLIKSGHHSVIEHENISVKFICDRGITHQIVRHRLAAYSQESTRYCNYKGEVAFVIPPWINDVSWGKYIHEERVDEIVCNSSENWLNAMLGAEACYIELLNDGWSPQQARSVLPNSLKTKIVMTANIREWRHVLRLRCSKAAHPQMQELMIPLLKEFQATIPVLFEDVLV